jgi:hypothetical protein
MMTIPPIPMGDPDRPIGDARSVSPSADFASEKSKRNLFQRANAPAIANRRGLAV